MIDPLEAVIELLYRDAEVQTVTAGRIAARHQFGDGWPNPSPALQVTYDGGEAELYVAWQRPRLQFRCYGADLPQANAVYRALVALSRRAQRQVVETSQGLALVYWLNLVTGPTFIPDPDIRDLYFVLVYAEAAVAETAVTGYVP